MAVPKNLVLHLYRHWEVIEYLCRLSRELPAFEQFRVLAAIERFSSQANQQAPAEVLRSLCSADLLQPLSRSEDLQINPLVLDFVRGLTREHELGLSAVLKARVEAVRDATRQLADGIEQQGTDSMRTGAARLSELFRQIAQQLDQDRHAILELAEKAKSSDASMPIARRYRSVLDAYDQYVEPMNEMMDSGLGGTFYPHLELAVQTLDRAEEYLSIRGALYTQRLQLRQVAQQAKELRRLGRVVAQQCADTLLPLREEARQHNALSTAISELLGLVRKRGLKTVLRNKSRVGALPGWQRERRTRIHLGDETRTLMAEAQYFEPQMQAFPEAVLGDPADLNVWVDERGLRQILAQALPVENLLLWLQQHNPKLPDAVLLRLYHDLVREPDWQAQLLLQETRTDLQIVRVSYHPHRLLPLSATKGGA
ncbi:hypothetical protein A8C75_09010 [Marinobacterium aestuarii]|uniref:Uncharacterized protein n=1 Tax=Marinobacterium aestuarii TaxID=1821621 RepID=A0A1A9EY83_9GAMM|nr:hypothetical protein [Marinobacterium aestuarii]ANG62608.1 hypothetical protein A8C75_09010 [Marinobacterium aestuarii]